MALEVPVESSKLKGGIFDASWDFRIGDNIISNFYSFNTQFLQKIVYTLKCVSFHDFALSFEHFKDFIAEQFFSPSRRIAQRYQDNANKYS